MFWGIEEADSKGKNKQIGWPGITWKTIIRGPEKNSSQFQRDLKTTKANVVKTACTCTLIGNRVKTRPVEMELNRMSRNRYEKKYGLKKWWHFK